MWGGVGSSDGARVELERVENRAAKRSKKLKVAKVSGWRLGISRTGREPLPTEIDGRGRPSYLTGGAKVPKIVKMARVSRCRHHTGAPNSDPTPAVSAIASAPQNVTRNAAFMTGAPPAWAPNPPKSARNTIDVAMTTGISAARGVSSTVINGIAAPTANVPADANAACTGLAVVRSEIPNSSRA